MKEKIVRVISMSSEHFAGLLKQLGESIGLPELKPSEQSLCSLRFDNKVTIDMEANEETGALIFSSILGTILPYQVEKFYPEFLQDRCLAGLLGFFQCLMAPFNLIASVFFVFSN